MASELTERRNWTDEELDLIVADYFAMLNDEASGSPYNKAEHNRLLQQNIDRSKGSIEFKHQNISAVLLKLGIPKNRWLLARSLTIRKPSSRRSIDIFRYTPKFCIRKEQSKGPPSGSGSL